MTGLSSLSSIWTSPQACSDILMLACLHPSARQRFIAQLNLKLRLTGQHVNIGPPKGDYSLPLSDLLHSLKFLYIMY
jgi:hypothetical protein